MRVPLLDSSQLQHRIPFLFRDWLNGKPHPAFHDQHSGCDRILLELFALDWFAEFLDQFDIHHVPAGIVGIAAGIVVFAVGIKRGVIRVTGADDFHRPENSQRFFPAVVEQDVVTDADQISQIIAGLVIPHTVPGGGFARCAIQSLDSKCRRFGFEKPVSPRGGGRSSGFFHRKQTF